MDFWYEKTVDAETAQKDAEKEPMRLKAGIIRHVWILHPPGCQGYLHTQILHRGHQLYPTLKGGSYHGDTFPIEFDCEWKIKKPAALTIRSWNVDEEFEHTVYVHVTVMQEKKDLVLQALNDMLKILKQLIGVE